MLYKSIQTFDFLPEENFISHYASLKSTIDRHIVTGYTQSFDGLSLYYEYFLCENPVGNIVIVHGLSEFTKKFYELAIFFLNQRYNVFLYDQRGHGYSGRETENLQALYVKSYQDYVGDLECIVQNVVEKVSPLPVTLYSQSMGGTVATLYLQKHPTKIKKAIFSAPMIYPNMNGAPKLLVRRIARRDGKKYGKDSPFFKSKPFNPESRYADSSLLSEARFRLYLQMRVEDERYQTSTLTNSWIEQTTFVPKMMLNKSKCRRIKTKCCIFSAEEDEVVQTKPQRRLARLLPHCKFVSVKNAKHTIFAATPAIMQPYFEEIRAFLSASDNE